MPPANTWRPRCRYWVKLERICFPEQTEELAPPGESVALKETLGRGPNGDQHVWIWPNNGFTAGSLFCPDAGELDGERFSVGSNGLALHR
jgi:hypothetical protein